MAPLPAFAVLAKSAAPPLDLLALALASELRPGEVDADGALRHLDSLGAELMIAASRCVADPVREAAACTDLLGGVHGFTGDEDDYDHPDNSMLDLVLQRGRGLPILLSVVYAEVARRADIPLAGVGLPGHFVVGRFDTRPPLLLDPFSGGTPLDATTVDPGSVHPWGAHDIAMRILNNLVAAYTRRGDLGPAIRAAELRLLLPSDPPWRETIEVQLRAMQARLN